MAIKNFRNKEYSFMGIINNNDTEEEMDFFLEKIKSKIEEDINLLLIYNKSQYKYLEKFIRGKEDYNLNIESFNIEFLIENKKIDERKLLLELEKKLKNNNPKNFNTAYLIIDGSWSQQDIDKVEEFYNELKFLGERYNCRFAIKYILSELNKGYINGMVSKHKYILVNRDKGFELYDSKDLISQSINTFSYYYEVESKYKEEMMRVEHLRAMGELTEGIVHDINNVFSIILGSLDIIKLNGYKEENKEYLETIYKSALDGSSIGYIVLNHMRGSNISTKSLKFLDNIINFSIDIITVKLRNLTKVNPVELNIKLNSNSYIYVNDYEIRQALLNIMFNAIDAMPKGGVLEIESYDEDDKAVLIIRDNGLGMSEDVLEKIYYPYFTTKGDSGTGIGLNMAKKIFDKYKVEVRVKTKEDIGTEFKMFFPVEDKI